MIDIPKNQTGEYYFSLLSKKQRDWFNANYIYDRQMLGMKNNFDIWLSNTYQDYDTFIRCAFRWDAFSMQPLRNSRLYWSFESQRTKPKVIQEVTITI